MLNNCEAKGLGCVLTLPIYRGREQHGNGREAGDKGTGSGRVRYGRREVLTPLFPPPPPFPTIPQSLQISDGTCRNTISHGGPYLYLTWARHKTLNWFQIKSPLGFDHGPQTSDLPLN